MSSRERVERRLSRALKRVGLRTPRRPGSERARAWGGVHPRFARRNPLHGSTPSRLPSTDLREARTMTVRINTPPDAVSVRLKRLVERLEAGEIKIPKFQRKFIWGKTSVLELLESLLSGYPIGSLLFWRTESNRFNVERDIEGFTLPPTPEKFPTDYVLDGQQRLTTVFGALRYDKPEEPHILNVVYDLRKKELHHRQANDPAWYLPLNIIFNNTKFNRFQHSIENQPDHDELDAEALRVSEAFQEYSVPVVTVLNRSLEEVCPIFERINSTGRKLTVYDLMVAATFADDFDLNDEVETLAKAIERKSYSMAGDSVLRTVSAIRGKTVKKADILALRKVPRPELRGDIVTTRKALEKAIDFLSTEVGVVTSEFLPYEAQLTVLGRAFHLLDGSPLSPEQRALLRDWYWLSSFRERYRGASDNILDGDLKNCEEFARSERPIIPVRRLEQIDLSEREFRSASALTHAYVTLLITCQPQSLLDGAPVDVRGSLSWENKREFHHIFPKGYLAAKSDEERKRQNDIANLMLLPSMPNKDISKEAPSIYMKRLRDIHGADRFDEILATNLIPPLEYSGLLTDDLKWFLDVRTELIVEKVNELARAPKSAPEEPGKPR
jgi:hypothetical protein